MTTNDPGGPTGPIPPAGSYTPPPPPPPPSSYIPPAPGSGFYPPGDVGTIKVFFIVSLVVNAIATLMWLFSVLGVGLATCGIGCLLIVLPAVTGAATVFDAMAVSKMGQAPNQGVYGFLKTTAIMDIVSGVIGMSVVPLVMGILALIFLQKPEVQRYYGIPA
jgi:hypothetical protein